MNSTALLVIVLIFLLIMFLVGYEKGAIRLVVSLITIMASMLIVSLTTPLVTKIVKNTPIYDTVYQQVEENVKRQLGYSEYSSDSIVDGENQKRIIDTEHMPKFMVSYLEDSSVLFNAELTFQKIAEELSKGLTDILITVVVYVVLFVLITIIARIAVNVLDLVSKLPIINTLNRLTGGCLGLLEGIIFVWVACLIVMTFQGYEWADTAIDIINSNAILKWAYDHNVLTTMIAGIL